MSTPTTPTFAGDTVAEDIQKNLTEVHNFAEQALIELMGPLQSLLANPGANLDELRATTQRMVDLTKARQKASESIQTFQQGLALENKVLETAADETTPVEYVRTKADEWTKGAVEYFDQSRKNLKESAQLLSNDAGFLATASSFFKKSADNINTEQVAQNFWDKVSAATFGLAVITSRVKNLPRVLMERLDQAIDKRVVAVSDVVEQWKHRSAAEYRDLKIGLKEIVSRTQNAAEQRVGAVKNSVGATFDKTAAGVSALDSVFNEFVEQHVVVRYENFVEAAKTRIASWSASAYDLLQEQSQKFGEHYTSELQRRRAQQAPQERIEPTLPKA